MGDSIKLQLSQDVALFAPDHDVQLEQARASARVRTSS